MSARGEALVLERPVAAADDRVEQRASARRRPWVELLTVGSLGVTTVAAYVWSGLYWLDLSDEGYFVYLSSRVYNGDLPYRDFDSYYTPGIFYVYSALFQLFGLSIMPVRWLVVAIKLGIAVLMYIQARRLVPWPFALLPFGLVLLADPWPVFPEPHPAWMAMMLALVTVEAVARHVDSPRSGWVVAMGVAAGLTFAFKQNVGAFAVLAVGAYLMMRARDREGIVLLATRLGYSLAVLGATAWLLAPALNLGVSITLLLPVAAALANGLAVGTALDKPGRPLDGVAPTLREGTLAGGAFVFVTLGWLVPLTFALGLHGTPFGLFVGAVNQGALILPMDVPSPGTLALGFAAIWAPVAVALALCRAARARWSVLTGTGALVTAALLMVPLGSGPRVPIVEDSSLYPWLTFLDFNFGTLYVFLPALAFWSALVFVIADRELPDENPHLRWYLIAGTLAILAVYPRVDMLHALFGGATLFVVGAWSLWRVQRWLVPTAGVGVAALVTLTLLAIPTAAVSSHFHWRNVTFLYPDPRAAVQPAYVPVQLERAPILLPQHHADSIGGLVRHVAERTSPGDNVFAYPAVPLLNFLMDRPNPTRFDHYLPGALTPHDIDAVVADLSRRKPRFVIWDHNGVVYWQTDLTNRPISDYLWSCYRQVANFTPYLVLERHCD